MSDTLLLGLLPDEGAIRERMKEAGFSEAAAASKAGLMARAGASLEAAGCDPNGAVCAFWVPGRIEVLGKHTDYAGGRSLLAATEQGFCFAAVPRQDRQVCATDVRCGERISFEMCPDLAPEPGHWSNYPMTVARRLARNFTEASRGAEVAFASDLPMAAGMSSSSAMIVGFFFVLAGVNGLERSGFYRTHLGRPQDLAGYLGTVENGQSFGPLEGDRGVGTFGGSEDHTAMLCCKPGRVSQYAYCPVRFEREVALPSGYTFAVGVSGVVAEKTGAAMARYNRASRLASTAAEAWRRASGTDDPHLASAIARNGGAAGPVREALGQAENGAFAPAELVARFDHFYAENEEIAPAAGDALAAGDLAAFGEQVDRSQALGAALLKNQVPETVFLARAARQAGACAASAFGAGFGGSVWALVAEDRAGEFLEEWAERYRAKHPEASARSAFFTTQAGPAAFEL